MATFSLIFFITTLAVIVCGLVINVCKRRASRTSHGLSGMCHSTGGEMCGCCSSRLLAHQQQRQNSCSAGTTSHQ